ncbi:NAD(P)-binding protein [Naviculisporaceae sp. PSN 640]
MTAQANITLQQVRDSNAEIDAATYPQTAVFIGGTAGIGEAAIRGLVSLSLRNGIQAPSRIYVIGRLQSAERTNKALDILRATNPHVDLVWISGDVSLLADVKRLCLEIKAREMSLDLLFLSTGYSPFGGREETPEGLPVTQSIGHYSRILFITHLLPLLNASSRGRVISVLGAGRESSSIDLTDLQLRKPSSWGGYKIQLHTITMQTVCLERLAETGPSVTFIHASPGLVNTGNLNRGWKDRWILQALANILLAPFFAFLSLSIAESAERMVWLATTGRFGPNENRDSTVQFGGVEKGFTTNGSTEGGDLYMVGWKGACISNEKELEKLRGEKGDVIWRETMSVIGVHL